MRNFLLRSLLAFAIAPVAALAANADLSIPVHSHTPDQPLVGGSINYFFTVHNSGPDAADNVSVRVGPQGGQQYGFSASPYPFTDNGDGTFSANLGSVAVGADVSFRISFNLTGAGPVRATAFVSSPDDSDGNNNSAMEDAIATQHGTTDLQMVSVTVQPNPAKLGELKRYHGILKNNGPDDAYGIAIGVQADSQNSSGVGFDQYETFVAASPAAAPAGADSNGIRSIPIGTVLAGTSVSFDVYYTAAQTGFVSRNFFTSISDLETDPNLNNNHLFVFSSNDSTGSGGLSATLLTVNGSTSPAVNSADTILTFVAQQSTKATALLLRVQWTTTPEDDLSWADLPDGNAGHMLFENPSDPRKFLLKSTNYPLQDGVYFRAVAKASGYDESDSNPVGPLNLAATAPHLGSTVFTMQGSKASFSIAPAGEVHFAATESTPAGVALHVQTTTTPEVAASWANLPDGNDGLMQQGSDPTQFTLDSRNYPAGDAVYFRVIALRDGSIPSLSNVIGPFKLVVDTPPVVTVTPPSGQAGSGSGADEDHPINILTGSFHISAHASSGRQITNLAILYDGDVLDRFNGQDGGVDYTTNVPGDHIIQAIAQDDLGTVGESAAVYLRVLPRNARIFFMVNSGNWSDANNWLDTKGKTGVPGDSDLAIVGTLSATLSQNTTAYAVVVNGGSITGPSELSVTGYLVITAGELRDMNFVIQPTATCHLINDVDVAMSGLITNLGKMKLSGSAGITGTTSPNLAANGEEVSPNSFNLFVAVKNFGSWLFQRKATPAKPKPRVVNVSNVTNRGQVYSNARAGLIGQDGNGVISHDGGGLIGQDGNGLISQDGNSFSVHRSGSSAATIASAASAADFVQESGETNLNQIRIIGSVGIDGGVLSGSGVIEGDLINSGGFIAPGRSLGVIAVTGNFQQEANGALVLEAAGTDPLQYDHLQISGAASLGGKLILHTLAGYEPDPTALVPLGYGSATGSFASVSSNTLLTLNATGAAASVDSSTPSPIDAALRNISTRARIGTGGDVLIGGFIVTGPNGSTKKVMVRGLGPSLAAAGLTGLLSDPLLELHKPDGSTLTNDNWADLPNKSEIPNGFAPQAKESVVIADLPPGNYTVIERGAHGETGVGLAEIYDLNESSLAHLGNIATRAFVDITDNVLIGGFIVGGTEPGSILVRAVGPSLSGAGIPNALADPILELHDANGSVFLNDDWRETQENEIIGTTIPPNDSHEPAILATLVPGNYTVIVRGKDNTTGVGLVEAYNVK